MRSVFGVQSSVFRVQIPMSWVLRPCRAGQVIGSRLVGVVLFALISVASLPALAEGKPLSILDERFTALETPVCMEYEVGYRLMNIELRRIGNIVATTTIGRWRHRITGQEVPALFVDMKVDSPDNGKPGERGRISIHDRIVAVLTVPDLQALVFAKYTDEYLNPLIGRTVTALSWSMYDTQSGQLEYESRELKTGVVSTNLVNREELLKLSRRIRPVMEFLVGQYKAPSQDQAVLDKGRIVANMDGNVVALRILTKREKSPSCLDRPRMDSMCIKTVAERGSSVRPRDFRAWSMTFAKMAEMLKDADLAKAARTAPMETIVPMAVDYELGLGSVRCTMTSIHVGKTPGIGHTAIVTKDSGLIVRE